MHLNWVERRRIDSGEGRLELFQGERLFGYFVNVDEILFPDAKAIVFICGTSTFFMWVMPSGTIITPSMVLAPISSVP